MEIYFSKVIPSLVDYSPKLITALLVLIIGRWLAGVIAEMVEKAMSKPKTSRTLVLFIKNIAYYSVLAFVVIYALETLGIKTTTFIAVLGAAGVAVAFALQGSLANFAAGVMIVLFQPFGIGDHVEAAGAVGTIEEIQIFNTIMRSDNGKKKIIPNSKIISDVITVDIGKA